MQRNHVFPNTRTEALYDAFTMSIELLRISRSNLKIIMEDPLSLENINYYRTIIHEICHYYDNISTLRGIELLTDVFDAYNSLTLMLNREAEMHRVIKLYNHYRKMKTEDYYKTIDEKIYSDKLEDIKDWSFSQTTGLKYNAVGTLDINKPIIFNRFRYKDVHIARMPFSIESLWEINAMATEIEYNMKSILMSKIEEVEMSIYLELLQKDSVKWIYNTDLLVYSAPVHIVSSRARFGEVTASYKIASILSNISLNLPNKYYSLVKRPKEIIKLIDKKRLNGFISQKDPAFMYLCLLHNTCEAMMTEDISLFNVEDILKASNLPNKKIIEDEIVKEMKKKRKDKLKGIFDPLYKRLYDLGISLFIDRGLGGDYNLEALTYKDIEKLPIICEDEICDDTELIKQTERLADMKKRVFEFAKACGY